MKCQLNFLITLIILLMPVVQVTAQDINTVTSSQKVDFTLIYNSIDLAFESWTQEKAPDDVKIAAYRMASGYLAGIPFHYEKNRDRMSIVEQIEKAADVLTYNGFREMDGRIFVFDYSFYVPADIYNNARIAPDYPGQGTSDNENRVYARTEARAKALESAVRETIRQTYTLNNRPVPGMVDGRITWYDIHQDQYDPDSGLYVFDITAWVSISEV